MHRVEEISLLRDQVEAVEADRDRWRRYAGMLRDRLAATQDAVRKWHHHAHCRDSYNGRVGEELRDLAGERDALNRQLDHADGRIIYLTSCVDALRQQLDESDHHLALRIEADNANRGQLAAAKDQVRMVVESWRQLKARYAESPANHAVPLALLLVHVGMLAGDSDNDAYLFLAALNRAMLDRAQCADLQEQLAECQGNLVRARTVCRETNEARENLLAGNRELIAARDAWKQRAEAEAGVMRRALEFYARAETYHVIGPNDGRRPIWEDTGEMARAALASGAGEKAGAVLAAAVSCAQAEERLEAAARARGPDIGPESHRAYVERLNLRNAVKLLLGDAVAAMEGKGDE